MLRIARPLPARRAARLVRPVPRNRTVRLAVLGSSVQRTAASGYPSTRSSAVRRRVVVGGLVLLSLVLITVSFRSSALDGVQGTASDVLRPFEVAAKRVSAPFTDTVGWVHGLVDAKRENKRLRRQVAQLQGAVVKARTAENQNAVLRRQLNYHGPASLSQFTRISAAVNTNPQNALSESVTIDAGSSAGVRDGDVVITPDGLVGTVAKTSAHVSRVTLITDELSSVTATDVAHPGSVGLVSAGNGGGVLDFGYVPKQDIVETGDTIITAGTPANATLRSLYPRGIVIGTVTSQSENDVDVFKNIQVQPAVDLTSIQSVFVLVPKAD
jgi:rod shape-determining protein MreC